MNAPQLSLQQQRSKLKWRDRVLVWFSCGDASAAAAKLSIERHGDKCEILYCDTFAYEHPDNRRFFDDVQQWLGREIKILGSHDFMDIYQVFDRTGWLVGPGGARCTTELKKVPRKEYQRPDDLHVFGFTAEEGNRITKFFRENPVEFAEFPLWEAGMTKDDCHAMVRDAGIELPAMYKLGYRNNNCIGCVKGGMGYWNKIRRDFPAHFDKMAAQERKMGHTILSDRRGVVRKRLFLDELDPSAGRYIAEPDIECGVLCTHEAAE